MSPQGMGQIGVGVMQIEHAGGIPCGKATGVWVVVAEIINKSMWLVAGVLVVMGIVGCSSAPSRVSRNDVGFQSTAVSISQTPRPSGGYSSPSRTGTTPSPRLVRSGRTIPKGGGVFKVGRPYRIAGKLYTPREQPRYNKTGKASWYGTDFHGRKTSNGEIYDMNALTAAHPTLPLPSYAYVTNLRNNRTVLVRINDRGPYAHGRIIDLSRAVGRALGFAQQGITDVRVRYAGRAPLNGNNRREVRYLASQPWSRRMAGRRGYGYAGLGGPPLR